MSTEPTELTAPAADAPTPAAPPETPAALDPPDVFADVIEFSVFIMHKPALFTRVVLMLMPWLMLMLNRS
jgi:hypothetical protein